jgi:hypothetical protein
MTMFQARVASALVPRIVIAHLGIGASFAPVSRERVTSLSGEFAIVSCFDIGDPARLRASSWIALIDGLIGLGVRKSEFALAVRAIAFRD